MKTENIKAINELQEEIESINDQIEELKQKVSFKQTTVEQLKKDLLSDMYASGTVEYFDEENKLYANVFSKSNIAYTSDNDVINKLKELGYDQFIKTKTTESLDKTPLKKELKTNADLKKELDQYVIEATTTYVTVTSDENHRKMLEHIEVNSK